MKDQITKRTIFTLILSLIAATAVWAQNPQLRTSTSRVRTLLTRMDINATNLKNEIERSRYDDMARNADERISNNAEQLSDAVQNLRRSTYSYRSADDIRNLNTILDHASRINMILARNATNARVNTRWAALKADVNTLAGYYGVAANWNTTGWGNNNNAGDPQLRTSGSQVRNVLALMRTRTTDLRREMDRERYDDLRNNADDRVVNNLELMTSAIDRLNRSSFTYGSADDAIQVNTILDRASRIDRVLSRNNSGSRVNYSWGMLRENVDTLAGYYGVTARWNNDNNWNDNTGWNNRRDTLTGTYRLNASQSDNVSTAIDRSLNVYPAYQRENIRRNLERRLASPDYIAIDKSGQRITMASSNQPQVVFDADGVARNERDPRGRTITTRVTSTNDSFTVDYSGDRVNDFNAVFDVDRNGRLRVTRKIYLENRNDTVSVSSVYDRISTTADWSRVPVTNNYGGVEPTNGFYVPNGVTLSATLRKMVSTKASQVGDRFTLDVTSPSQYRGAVIEGHVTQADDSGRISGRANIQLDFDTITMNGQTYQFAGLIQSVTAANGDSVSVNNEGAIRDSSQTGKTVKRAGIGAVLGAIIGAIADGGSGAAIGAGIGAGAGAGTVLISGKDNIELGQGSTLTIQSSAPTNAGYYPRN